MYNALYMLRVSGCLEPPRPAHTASIPDGEVTVMTGTGKRVIEIAEPEHECIDRVLVLLKPGLGDVQLSHAADDAGRYVRRLIVRRSRYTAAAAAALSALLGLGAGLLLGWLLL